MQELISFYVKTSEEVYHLKEQIKDYQIIGT